MKGGREGGRERGGRERRKDITWKNNFLCKNKYHCVHTIQEYLGNKIETF